VVSEETKKIALFLCDCGKTLETNLDYMRIQDHFTNHKDVFKLLLYQDLCFDERLDEITRVIKDEQVDWSIIAACTPQVIEMPIKNKLKAGGLKPNLEIVNIREHCAWVHSNRENATEKAIMLIEGAISKSKLAISVERKEDNFQKHVTVLGGGVAGLSIASDLCNLGFRVSIIEKGPRLGGHVFQLEKVVPFNKRGKDVILDCMSNLEGKEVDYKLNTRVNWIEGGIGDFRLNIQKQPTYISTDCDFCGKCIEVCPITMDDPLNEGLSKIKVIDRSVGAPFGETMRIYREMCPNGCDFCESICPKKAINLSKQISEETLRTSLIVFSTGYELYRPDETSIFQPGKNSDIITQLQLARLLDPDGPTKGRVLKPSSGDAAKRILMIQCVGSRDVRHAEYCSKYCCSTAIRHAMVIKEQVPESVICLSYIDIRTPFLDEELYREAREMGIEFIRGKIGNIRKEANQFITEVVDTVLARQINFESDMIVLSTAMLPGKIPPEISEILDLKLKDNGFVQEYYPKLKLTETNKIGIYCCGAASGPKLVPESIAEAHSVAVSIVKDYASEKLIREQAISIVDEELCNGCELCVRLCPFKIPILIEKEGREIAYIDQNQCQGCGTCVSLCPTNAVQLESLQRDQLFAQIKGTLADAATTDDPIILGFVCEECAYATIDFTGMLRKTYSESTRFIRLPCVGRLSILDILTAFEYGADMILIFGCEEEKCHYLEGNTRTKIIVDVVNELLEGIGWQPERIKMYGLFSADSNKFIAAVEDALEDYTRIGHSSSRLKLLKGSS
jgi:heterodisulfide reductase subunit A-like polyferredoxin/coenzyme F420-reducing hydrogenase delta subunit